MENWEDIQNKDGFYITVNLPTTQPQTAAAIKSLNGSV